MTRTCANCVEIRECQQRTFWANDPRLYWICDECNDPVKAKKVREQIGREDTFRVPQCKISGSHAKKPTLDELDLYARQLNELG